MSNKFPTLLKILQKSCTKTAYVKVYRLSSCYTFGKSIPINQSIFCGNFRFLDASQKNHLVIFPVSSFSSDNKNPSVEKLDLKIDSEKIEAERAEKHERSRKNLKYTSIGLGVIFLMSGGMVIYSCGAPKRDDFGNLIVDEFSEKPYVSQFFSRAWQTFWSFVKSVPEPSRDKLLPDPLKEPYYQPKYTIVFEISGVFVHPDWTLKTGWRFKRRPAVEYFLKSLGYPRSELVVYTSEHGLTAHPIIDSLDPESVIMYRLYRDTTKYKDGVHIKDLGKLNRDLTKVIYIDWDNKAFELNPENALRIPKWDGEDDDTALVDLANLLRTIIDSNVDDVRPVVQYYSSFPDPLKAFQEKQDQVKKMERSMHSETRTAEQSLTKNWSGKLFGYGRH